MRDREGSRETFEVSENPGRDRQGVGGVVESLRVTDTPVVEEFPRGCKTSVVTLEGNRMPGADRQGPGGDENFPATRDTKGSSNISRGEEM